MLEESIKTSATLGNSLTPRLVVIYNRRITAKFKGNCLIQDDICFIYKNLVNLYFVYKLDTRLRYLKTNFTLGDCLFGAVQLTKNAVAHKFKCTGMIVMHVYNFHCQIVNGLKLVIFGVDKSYFVHVDNRKRYLSS